MQSEVLRYSLVALDAAAPTFAIDGTGELGRAELGDAHVSRQCARLLLTAGGAELKIQRLSRSPIFVTRAALDVEALELDRVYLLRAGDVVSFGPRHLHYMVQRADQPSDWRERWLALLRTDRRVAIASMTAFECVLCLETLKIDDAQPLACGHRYCRDCLRQYFANCIADRRLPIVCPGRDCASEVAEQELRRVLDETEMQRYQAATLNLFVEGNSAQFSCCPTPDCAYLFHFRPGDCDFLCPQCGKRYCLNCQAEFHAGQSCAQFQQWRVANGQADTKFEEFALGNKLKQCGQCKRWVEKKSGCNHITCLCGAQFCYVCGEAWGPGLGKCNAYRCRSSVTTGERVRPVFDFGGTPTRPYYPLAEGAFNIALEPISSPIFQLYNFRVAEATPLAQPASFDDAALRLALEQSRVLK